MCANICAPVTNGCFTGIPLDAFKTRFWWTSIALLNCNRYRYRHLQFFGYFARAWWLVRKFSRFSRARGFPPELFRTTMDGYWDARTALCFYEPPSSPITNELATLLFCNFSVSVALVSHQPQFYDIDEHSKLLGSGAEFPRWRWRWLWVLWLFIIFGGCLTTGNRQMPGIICHPPLILYSVRLYAF